MCLLSGVLQWLVITTLLRVSEGVDVEAEMSTGLNVDLWYSNSFHELLPSLEDCGVEGEPHRIRRVVGGRPVPKWKYPWLAQLYVTNVSAQEDDFNCGGTFITDRIILTAAHCLSRVPAGDSFLMVGFGHSLRTEISHCPWNAPADCNRKFTRQVAKVVVHPNYVEGNLNNDIGIAILKHPVVFNSAIRPVCLPFSEELLRDFSSPRMRISGWGSTNKFDKRSNSTASDVAMEADIYITERKYCDKFHTRQYGQLGGNRFCALGEAGKGGCNGDSGGPVTKSIPLAILDGEKRTFQMGLVSSGDPGTCGYQGRPMIFGNVLFFMPWLLRELELLSNSSTSLEDSEEFLSVVDLPVSSREKLSSKRQFKSEFSTGLNISVLSHPNINKLPTSDQCGSIPAPKPKPKPTLPSSEEDVMYDDAEENRVKRIIGGRIAGISWFPFMAQIYARDAMTGIGDLYCAGMIIAPKVILTAASCVTHLTPPQALDYVQVGNFNRNVSRECTPEECFNAQVLSISEVTVHEGFTKYAYENDIALIKLGKEIKFGIAAQPVCLPLYESLIDDLHLTDDTRFLSVGWGLLSKPPPFGSHELPKSNLPQHIDVKLKHRMDCENVYTRILGKLNRSRFCGGGEPGKGECNGDSGGPLMKPFMVKRNETTIRKYMQFGIISFYECGTQGLPTIYTNILYHMPWVLDHL